MVRYLIAASVLFFCAGTLTAQEKSPADSFRNTIQVNVLSLLDYTGEIVYTRSISQKFNFFVQAGYAYTYNRKLYGNEIRNLVAESINGFHIKAGPEIPQYFGEKGRGSFALYGIYGRGRMEHKIAIEHQFGIYRDNFPSQYEYYGAGGSGTIRALSIGSRWFLDTGIDLNICSVKTDALIKTDIYPGIGMSQQWPQQDIGMGWRVHCRVGYNF